METLAPRSNSTDTSVADSPAVNGYDLFQLACTVAMTVLGVPGNCLILRVYHCKRRRTTARIFILTLAWADLLACLLSTLTAVSFVMELAGTPMPVGVNNAIVFIKATPLTVSLYLTAVIAVDRYDCTCRPLRRLLDQKRAKMAVVCSLVFSVVFSIPYLLGYVFPNSVVVLKTGIATQYVSFFMVITSVTFCYGKVYWKIRQHVRVGALVSDSGTHVRSTESATAKAAPSNNTSDSLSIIDLRTKTADRSQLGESSTRAAPSAPVPETWRSGETADASSSTPRQVPGSVHQLEGRRTRNATLQRKTTRMLFITSVVFLLTWMPYWIYMAVYMAALSAIPIDPSVFQVFSYLIYMVYFNNVINPFIYGLANSRFRKDCLDVLRKLKRC